MIPVPALHVLDMIRETETGYDDLTAFEVIYGHHQDELTKKITEMTVAELQGYQPGFSETWGSSASGAYQFMYSTLGDLLEGGYCLPEELFVPQCQNELGFVLLNRRGYANWMVAVITTDDFMIGLAKEWASFPVPYDMQGAHRWVTRGQSYYAGDGVNKALITPEEVWTTCEDARHNKTPPWRPLRDRHLIPLPKPEDLLHDRRDPTHRHQGA